MWNVHNEMTEDGYMGGVKRRPRTEWLMQRDTHQALITDTEAEAILKQLELGRIKTHKTRAKYLLTGMLINPEGEVLHGDGGYYRVGKKSVKMTRVDGAVLSQIAEDLQSDAFVSALVKSAHKSSMRSNDGAELENAQKTIRAIDGKIDRLSNLLAETSTPAPLLRKIEALEQERSDIRKLIETIETATKQASALRQIESKDVKMILQGIAESIDELDRDDLKEILRNLIERIVFDFATLDCCIYYKIPVKSRDLVASPTRFELVLSP